MFEFPSFLIPTNLEQPIRNHRTSLTKYSRKFFAQPCRHNDTAHEINCLFVLGNKCSTKLGRPPNTMGEKGRALRLWYCNPSRARTSHLTASGMMGQSKFCEIVSRLLARYSSQVSTKNLISSSRQQRRRIIERVNRSNNPPAEITFFDPGKDHMEPRAAQRGAAFVNKSSHP